MPFDPADPEFLADPYRVFADLRAHGEVHEHAGLGMAVAVSHAACSAVLRDRGLGRLWVDARPASSYAAFNLLHRNSLLEREPPSHTRLRSLVAAAFGRGHIERLRPWITDLADGLVATLVEQIDRDGRADLLDVVAAPLPVEVIAELLGVAAEQRSALRPWSNAIVRMYEYGLDEHRRQLAEQASAAFVDFLRGLVELRRHHPGPDLVSDLLAVADADGARLSEDELIGTAVLLLMAGHEASVNVLGNGVLALLDNPEQWHRLVADRGVMPTAVEELIRFDPPLQLFVRTAATDTEIAGFPVAAGGQIGALLGAAARDPAVFDRPNALDITRHPNPHLGFGAGIHYCLGAPLARVELTAALDALRTRLPTLALAAQPRRRPEFVIRGLRELWVTR